jgi:hypothetical protein
MRFEGKYIEQITNGCTGSPINPAPGEPQRYLKKEGPYGIYRCESYEGRAGCLPY